uniref:Transposable element protein, putative, Transposase_28 n=2 Tax=Oryza sativa subsp. japonica TaxID=39947 RepID=Q6AV74_ORYSJ|nr:putative gypsy type transposon [Oryza sativa Japonica Group]ABF96892.1 Transposable element protein, putative, Transposase_28 [Oryza sativa Japonica Group]
MAPRKPNLASAKGPDPGRVDDDSTAFLGVSLMDDVELAKLVSSGALVKGQAFAPGKAVVPKPVDNRTVVFAVFFEVGLRFPCNVLLPDILRLFQVELPQLSPSPLVRISIFDWACRTSGFEPSAELFGAIFFATVNSKMVITPAGTKKTVFGSMNFNVRLERSDLWPVNAAMSKWDRHWMARWFYHTIPFAGGSDSAKALTWWRSSVCFASFPSPSHGKSQSSNAKRLTVCRTWFFLRGRTLAPRKRRVPASLDSDADDEDDAEERDGKDEGEEEEEVEAVADKAANEVIEDRVDTPGYTPTPSPRHNETGVESNSSPLRRKDLEGAKALVAFSSGKAAKGGLVKKISKKKGLVDIARVFSDDESSDETPTSPAGRSLDFSTAPLAPLGVAGAGGSAATGASASVDRIVSAAARVFGSPACEPAISPLVKTKGKCAATEASTSEYSLATPHFAPGDFETRADLIPFVEGVSNLVLPTGTPSIFTELNEFDEGCSTIKSLAVRILAAHCSTERTVRARFDGFKSRLRAKDDEISRKNLEVESAAIR